MKMIFLFLGCLSFLSGAELDFSKVFPKEKLFGENNLGEMKSYTYLTNTRYQDLEKQLIKFLGDEWKKEQPVDLLKVNEELAAVFKKQGLELKGTVTFTQKDDFGQMVIMQVIKMKMAIGGKEAMLSLTIQGGKEAVEDEKEKDEPTEKEQGPVEKQPTGGILEKSAK